MHLLGLMKSLGGADRDSSRAFGSAELKSMHMTQLCWLSSRILAEFQKLKTDPLSLLYNLDTLSMEKLRGFFCGRTEEPTSENTNLVILCLEEKKGQTPLSSEQLCHLKVYAKHENFEIVSARMTYQLHYIQ